MTGLRLASVTHRQFGRWLLALVVLAFLAPGVSRTLESLRVQAEPWTEICTGIGSGFAGQDGDLSGHTQHDAQTCGFCCTGLDTTALTATGDAVRVGPLDAHPWQVRRASGQSPGAGAWPAALSRAPPFSA